MTFSSGPPSGVDSSAAAGSTTEPSIVDPAAADALRRQRLRKAKAFAASLLLLAALIYIATLFVHDPPGWVGYVRAMAEASMVGALADWFAVTALFRRPLGLPIPHTAIIPEKKDELGAALGSFVQQNFLAKDVIVGKLRTLGVGARLGGWLARPENAERLTENAGDALSGLAQVMRDEDIHAAIEQIVRRRVAATPAAPIAARGVELVVDGNHHQVLLDAVLRGLSRFLEENRHSLRERLGQESPWWVPESVDDRVFDKGLAVLQKFLAELVNDPRHELRVQYDEQLRELAERLRTDPELAAKAETMKADLMVHPAVRDWTRKLGTEIKRSVSEAATDPDSELRKRMAAAIVSLGNQLCTDPALQAKVDGWLEGVVGYLVEQYGAELADLVTGTVRSWDTDQTSRKIELQVGRDLQWIRVNGTVVGGLAGLVIYTVGQLVMR
jgi:uncharacterized membrane-anchored protein YjiN (DUF445 family)